MTTHPDLAEWEANIGSSEILDVRLVEEGGESRQRTLRGTAVLRHLPGRRLVVRTDWDGSPAVLKMFIGPGAERYRDRELAGLDNLAAAGARIPERLALVRAPVTTGNHRGGRCGTAGRIRGGLSGGCRCPRLAGRNPDR